MTNCFTRKTSWFWQNAENWLIILFLATFTLNIRKVFLTSYSFMNGTFNEYMTPSFSWVDLLMLAVMVIYTIKAFVSQFINHTTGKTLLNIVICFMSSVIRRVTNVSRETIILILFLLWIGFSIFWSQYKLISLYRFATFLEMALFACIALKSLKNQKWLDLALFTLIINGIFQSILGIAQFVHNKSLGLHWLGESIIAPNIDGVAKIIIGGEKHIRAYGTFPHPNILAGFLIIPIFLILDELLKRFVLTENCNQNVSRGTIFSTMPSWLIMFSFIILITGFLLTFSRSAFLGLILGLLVFGFVLRKAMPKIFRLALLGCLLLFSLCLGYFVHSNKDFISLSSTQSLQERIFYQNVARETISVHPLKGVGVGQFVFHEFQKYPNFVGWQYQPVHNIFLLIFSELGIFGLILFLLWIFSILEKGIEKNSNTSLLLTSNIYYCIIFSFIFIFLFDHYFWDIKLGMIIFVLPTIFLKSASYKKGAVRR
jgi:O-antigen ligase